MAHKPQAPSAGFELQVNKTEENFSWSTEKVEQLMIALEDGYKPKTTPFYEGNPNLKKGNLVFNYTSHELKEIKKCATDIVYFANMHCTVMTDKGLQTIKLRPYQEDMLRSFQKNRFNVCLASRQIGKCVMFSTEIMLLRDGKCIKTTVGNLYFEQLKSQRPLTFFEKSKWFLWKIYEKINSFDTKQNLLKASILNIIQILERFEYKNTSLDQTDISKKIINSLDLDNTLISTDSGWEQVSSVHITQPYDVYRIVLENGMYLEGADNHILFTEKYEQIFIKDINPDDLIITLDGPVKVKNIIKYKPSVSMFDVTVDSQNHRYWSNGILSHNTICSSIYIAWYSLFNFDKNALILSNKGATTREIIDKGKTILEHLPFFLKPGVLKWDVFNSRFDNGCRIIGQTTTKKAAIGFTIHLLFMDEFAHIPQNFVETFYENVYPTVSASSNSKVIITSTPNGFNKFYDIYSTAEKGLNEYTPFRVDWWDVPGRDEAWMRQEVANLGSEEAFNRQYGNQFIASSSLLLGADSLKKLQKGQKEFVHREIPEFEEEDVDYAGLLWDPDFNLEEIEEDTNYWVFSIDIAEGNGGDYSIINIFKIELMDETDWKKVTSPGSFTDFFRLRQVGRFRSNEHTIEEFAKAVYILAFDMFYSENLKLIIEWNMFGGELIRRLDTVFPQRNDFDEEMVVKFKHRIDAKVKNFGLKIKKDNKPIFCQNFKKYITQNKIILKDKKTVYEASTFGKLPNGSYAGQLGNDDLIMTSINSSEFFFTLDFFDFAEEIYDQVDDRIQEKIDNILENDAKGGNLNYDIYDIV